jgi:hypothetical protein
MPEASRQPPPATKSQLDEHRLSRGVALGLPLVTLVVAAVVGMLSGPATSLLVIAAGLLLGVIALLWGSLRILSGDAELPPELEALDMAAQGVDALSGRKKMLLRALKDLENEHAIGKLEDDDYEQIAATYRQELKGVLKRIDDSLAPHRVKAEELARAHLVRAGIADAGYRGEQPTPEHASASASAKTKAAKPARVECPNCRASNEPDAKFCKECAEKLVVPSATPSAARENETTAPSKESADA